jgi:dipeptidyl aminopeptidase/acylaminoacyl peptidase
MRKYFFVFILFICPQFISAQGLDTLQLKTIFHQPYLPGVRPSFINFSPDNKSIFFSGNDSAKTPTKIYSVDLNGKNETLEKENDLVRSSISPDGKKAVYTKKGDIWIYDIKNKKSEQLTQSKSFENGVNWSPDSKRITFSKDGNVFVMSIDKPGFIQLTEKKEEESSYSVETWVGNDKILVQQYDNSDYKEVFFPEYVGKFVKPGNSKRGIPKLTLSLITLDEKLPSKTIFTGQGWFANSSVNENADSFLLGWVDQDMKNRTVYVYSIKKDTLIEVLKETTEGWISNQFTKAEYFPKGNSIVFESEKDGWNHLYTMNDDGSNQTQLTKGEFEIDWFEFISDDEIVFSSSEKDLGERALKIMNIKKKSVKNLTNDEAFREEFSLSSDKKTVVYLKTTWNKPHELVALDLKKGTETQLTHSIPERFNSISWQQPEYYRFLGRDGDTKINMTALKPVNYDASKKYPVIVFVHGAGSLQNVYKGWSASYWREYMFHQYLTTKGYVVVEVDYRHSTGYGRKFREDVTNWMGKYETEDIIDGLDYAQEQLGILDLEKVGVYGGSYGGFMALYAVSTAPERFHAAAALRAVTNWENYYNANQWYTRPRLGTPEANPENYKRSSPLSYADTLKRPVLILHGLIDNNVGFQDAVQYVEKLIQSGNEHFEMMMYPSERHSFTDPDAWYDEYRRIFKFFESKLK